MSGRRRFICPNGFHRATRLCFRAFDAMKLMTSGASPIAQMSRAVSKDRRPSRLRTSTWAGTVVRFIGAPEEPRWRARRASSPRNFAKEIKPLISLATDRVGRLVGRFGPARNLRSTLDEGLPPIDRGVAAHLEHPVLHSLEKRCPPKAKVVCSNHAGRANQINSLTKQPRRPPSI